MKKPTPLEDALVYTFKKRKSKGKDKPKPMMKMMSKKKHEGMESKMFERGE